MKLRLVSAVVSLSAAAAITLSACSADEPQATEVSSSEAVTSDIKEEAGPRDRLVATYDGGVMVIDAQTLEVIETFKLEGFNRLNPAGDGRHVMVTTQGGWQLLDAGTWTEPHGDHTHSFSTQPRLTDVKIPAKVPGHVVNHEGKTALWDDGTGKTVLFDSEEWTEFAEKGMYVADREYQAPEAFHGVAVPTMDNQLFVAVGTGDKRSGAALLDTAGKELAATDQCPGIHGETVAGDAIVAGCENGAIALHGDHFQHFAAPDEFGRIGNLFATEGSRVVLGDYKSDPEGGYGLSHISLIDLDGEKITTIDTGAQYTFRDLARGLDNVSLVLGTDGKLRVYDEAGELLRSVDAIDAWEAPEEWQTAHPALVESDGYAYVTDPAHNKIVQIDYTKGEIVREAVLPHATNEITVATGQLLDADMHKGDGHEHEHEGEDHDHEGHDHEHDGHDHEHEGEAHDHSE